MACVGFQSGEPRGVIAIFEFVNGLQVASKGLFTLLMLSGAFLAFLKQAFSGVRGEGSNNSLLTLEQYETSLHLPEFLQTTYFSACTFAHGKHQQTLIFGIAKRTKLIGVHSMSI